MGFGARSEATAFRGGDHREPVAPDALRRGGGGSVEEDSAPGGLEGGGGLDSGGKGAHKGTACWGPCGGRGAGK